MLILSGLCFAPILAHEESVESTAAEADVVAFVPTPTPTPSPTSKPTATPTPTPESSPTPTEAPTVTPTEAQQMPVIDLPTPENTDGLQLVYMTCYLPTGNNCADGTPPRPGVCASAPWRIGQDCILYHKDTLEVITRLECRDTGGHPMLQNGTAIDVFVVDMTAAWEWIGMYGDHVYIEWVPREE